MKTRKETSGTKAKCNKVKVSLSSGGRGMSQTWRILLLEVENEFHPKYRSHQGLILGGEGGKEGNDLI